MVLSEELSILESCCKTNTSVNVRVQLWRFCVEKHQTSFLQICGLQTVQISIQLITWSVLSCSVVYTRGKSTPSTNWSRGWLKFGAALNSRLLTWLLISGAKDLIRACVRAKGGHFERSLWTYWLSWFHQLFVTFFVIFAWILHRWVKQHCCKGSHSHYC